MCESTVYVIGKASSGQQEASFGGVKSCRQIFHCAGVGTPNHAPLNVQGSTTFNFVSRGRY